MWGQSLGGGLCGQCKPNSFSNWLTLSLASAALAGLVTFIFFSLRSVLSLLSGLCLSSEYWREFFSLNLHDFKNSAQEMTNIKRKREVRKITQTQMRSMQGNFGHGVLCGSHKSCRVHFRSSLQQKCKRKYAKSEMYKGLWGRSKYFVHKVIFTRR